MHSSFLKEMGITQWTSRDLVDSSAELLSAPIKTGSNQPLPESLSASPRCHWWFFGEQSEGDIQILFQNIVRILGLTSAEWTWVKPSEKLNSFQISEENIPMVAVAFGSSSVQKITGERDPIMQLRETVLVMSGEGNEEIPVLASFDLNHFISRPRDKAFLWQDLLLAKSVLLSI